MFGSALMMLRVVRALGRSIDESERIWENPNGLHGRTSWTDMTTVTEDCYEINKTRGPFVTIPQQLLSVNRRAAAVVLTIWSLGSRFGGSDSSQSTKLPIQGEMRAQV